MIAIHNVVEAFATVGLLGQEGTTLRAKNAKSISSLGTGLGLTLTKIIAEKHGGTISATSTEGEGTVFTVRLPAISP